MALMQHIARGPFLQNLSRILWRWQGHQGAGAASDRATSPYL